MGSSETSRISSPGKRVYYEVVHRPDGCYALQRFVLTFDQEESQPYAVRALPDPTGLFGDETEAAKEARRLLLLDD